MKTIPTLIAILFAAATLIQPIKAQDMNSKITTFLMFEGQAEEAMIFYTSLFDDSEIVRIERHGPDGPGGTEAEGTVLNGLFTLKGRQYMAFDSPAPHPFSFTPSISLFVECDSEEELELLFDKLGEGGEVLMPIDNYGFSTKYGWVQDRFGVSWQLNYGQLNF
jgi:predicted 3-demethylubiquinone-9 3-methyltransferase (glyoxalase superfamily)